MNGTNPIHDTIALSPMPWPRNLAGTVEALDQINEAMLEQVSYLSRSVEEITGIPEPLAEETGSTHSGHIGRLNDQILETQRLLERFCTLNESLDQAIGK